MDLICLQGAAPGLITATISHAGNIRQMRMSVARHPSGGWRIALPEGGFGPRCHSVPAAILMEASETFTTDDAHLELDRHPAKAA
jgi:hypothetical protein